MEDAGAPPGALCMIQVPGFQVPALPLGLHAHQHLARKLCPGFDPYPAIEDANRIFLLAVKSDKDMPHEKINVMML